jgi:hypothetical protein
MEDELIGGVSHEELIEPPAPPASRPRGVPSPTDGHAA